MESTPQSAVISAMTTMLSEKTYNKVIRNTNGGRMYIFGDAENCVDVAGKWKKEDSVLLVEKIMPKDSAV